MNTLERIERLEMLAMNQTLIIKHLTKLIAEVAPMRLIERAQEASAEDLLGLVFEQDVPVSALDLAAEWRVSLSKEEIMQTS